MRPPSVEQKPSGVISGPATKKDGGLLAYLMLAALSSAKVDSDSGSLKIELESCV